MTFNIRKDLPVPPPNSAIKWPFNRMLPGDSVDIDGVLNTGDKARYAAHSYGQSVGKKFRTVRIQSGGVRVWRVS